MISVVTISFAVCLAAFVGVGLLAARRRAATADDYLIASRSMGPWFVALSAVATQNSGFMFVGLTGAAFAEGLAGSIWLMLGWIVGDLIAWLLVHERLRRESERVGATTIPGFLAHGMRGGRAVAIVAAVITLGFLVLYAAAQLTAGRKALQIYGIDETLGVVIGAAMVGAYCIAGGIRASIWTDVAQSVVMLLSITLLAVVALISAGGPVAAWQALAAIDGGRLTNLTPPDLQFGLGMFILGWVFAGFGVVGQPHIMVRTFTLESVLDMRKARTIYLTWFSLFSVACVAVGLLARVVLGAEAGLDSELAFPMLSEAMLPAVLVGLMLAGVFAATISTADSQVLSCSAAITQDLVPPGRIGYRGVKVATLVVTAFALVLALLSIHTALADSVFVLVTFAWSGLAGSLGPLLVVRARGGTINAPLALVMMVGGLTTVLVWRFALGYAGSVYDALPGVVAGLVIYAVGRLGRWTARS